MQKLIFLDTETTGNDVEKDRLCQVCYKNSRRHPYSLFQAARSRIS